MADERPPERDETRPMESVGPPDETRPMESVGPPDETRPMDAVNPPDEAPVDAARPLDETRPMAAADATRIQPSDGPRSDDRDHEIWTGRAEVRAPRPGTEFYESDWADPAPREPQGRWWAPIAVGSAALVLLGLLGFGIAMIVRSSGGETETPATTPATVSTTTARTTAATSATTTTAATTSPTLATTEPTTDPANAEVTVPALRGMPLADAQAALQRTGLTFRVIQRESEAEPGTVINSDPPEGSLVPSDTRITLVVASAPATSPATTATTTPAGEAGEVGGD
ncbi:PASTA domain-containing protein [Actinoplanes missouriensis]|uniref:PASTA domain-containing protein n=1 Tax=Actinoplanes missouriensis TaxID=1866 RepID=UPI0033CD154C